MKKIIHTHLLMGKENCNIYYSNLFTFTLGFAKKKITRQREVGIQAVIIANIYLKFSMVQTLFKVLYT